MRHLWLLVLISCKHTEISSLQETKKVADVTTGENKGSETITMGELESNYVIEKFSSDGGLVERRTIHKDQKPTKKDINVSSNTAGHHDELDGLKTKEKETSSFFSPGVLMIISLIGGGLVLLIVFLLPKIKRFII